MNRKKSMMVLAVIAAMVLVAVISVNATAGTDECGHHVCDDAAQTDSDHAADSDHDSEADHDDDAHGHDQER